MYNQETPYRDDKCLLFFAFDGYLLAGAIKVADTAGSARGLAKNGCSTKDVRKRLYYVWARFTCSTFNDSRVPVLTTAIAVCGF